MQLTPTKNTLLRKTTASLVLLTSLLFAGAALAEPRLSLPPAGDNQKTSITQHMGLVQVTIEYNSVDVHAPNGEDRSGKIWGQLVPWGMIDLGFAGGKKGPWRGGSNENTTFAVSHDVEIEGKKLAAGKYGLHFIPAENGEWTLILSKNAQAWGSFFYDEKDDVLRVPVKAESSDYNEWLTYDFDDRQLDTCRVALKWEKLKVPFRVKVPDILGLYVANLRQELTSFFGFQPEAFEQAANFLLQRDTEGKYDELALEWSNQAMNPAIGGRRSFAALIVQTELLERMKRLDEAKKHRQEALKDPIATPIQIHFYARRLTGQGRHQEALEIFQENARRFPGVWPTDLGLTRGYAGVGDLKKALEAAKKALASAPDDPNKRNVEAMIARLEKGENIN